MKKATISEQLQSLSVFISLLCSTPSPTPAACVVIWDWLLYVYMLQNISENCQKVQSTKIAGSDHLHPTFCAASRSCIYNDQACEHR